MKINFDSKYFLQNNYTNKYLALVNRACQPDYNLGKFPEKHHLVPVAYYKLAYNCKSRRDAEKLADKDPNNIKIFLSIEDHILIHYYLALFSNDKLKKPMSYCFIAMLDTNKAKVFPKEFELLKKLPKLAQIRREKAELSHILRQGKIPWNKGLTGLVCEVTEAKLLGYKKAGKTRHTKKWINKDKRNKFVELSEINNYLLNGWKLGLYMSEAAKSHIAYINKNVHSTKNYIFINNGKNSKSIKKELLNAFLKNGWKVGRIPLSDATKASASYRASCKKHAELFKTLKTITSPDGKLKRIKESELEYYISLGWTRGNKVVSEYNKTRNKNKKEVK